MELSHNRRAHRTLEGLIGFGSWAHPSKASQCQEHLLLMPDFIILAPSDQFDEEPCARRVCSLAGS